MCYRICIIITTKYFSKALLDSRDNEVANPQSAPQLWVKYRRKSMGFFLGGGSVPGGGSSSDLSLKSGMTGSTAVPPVHTEIQVDKMRALQWGYHWINTQGLQVIWKAPPTTERLRKHRQSCLFFSLFPFKNVARKGLWHCNSFFIYNTFPSFMYQDKVTQLSLHIRQRHSHRQNKLYLIKLNKTENVFCVND